MGSAMIIASLRHVNDLRSPFGNERTYSGEYRQGAFCSTKARNSSAGTGGLNKYP
jgi:hypothetical protein